MAELCDCAFWKWLICKYKNTERAGALAGYRAVTCHKNTTPAPLSLLLSAIGTIKHKSIFFTIVYGARTFDMISFLCI